MINFSRSYTYILHNLFFNIYTDRTVTSNDMPEQIAYLQFSAQDSEIPCLYTQIVNPNEEKIYITPLYLNSQEYNCRTSEVLIKKFFTLGDRCGYLFKGNLGDRIYYGNKGILLDKNYNILFLATSEPRRTMEARYRHIYVSPKVFTDLKDPINKHIVQKIIPFFCQEDPNVNIHIKDMNHLLKKPIFPKNIYTINDELNNILITNTDYLIQ